MEEDVVKMRELVRELFPGEVIQSVQRLGGLTNHTYYVMLNQEEITIRIPGEGTEELINRREEYISTDLACRLGIDSRLIYFEQETGVKVARYIPDAVTMSPDSMKEEENICLAADILKRLHSCGGNTGVAFDVFDTAKGYEKIIREHDVPLFDDYEEVSRCVREIRQRAFCPKEKWVPCHNDPLCENWVRSGERMYLIDWEYAGMNDPMWDVADIALEAGYERKQEVVLVEHYLGHDITDEERESFRANKIYIDFLWSLWGKTRVPYDGESMETYARERYIRLRENIKNYYK